MVVHRMWEEQRQEVGGAMFGKHSASSRDVNSGCGFGVPVQTHVSCQSCARVYMYVCVRICFVCVCVCVCVCVYACVFVCAVHVHAHVCGMYDFIRKCDCICIQVWVLWDVMRVYLV